MRVLIVILCSICFSIHEDTDSNESVIQSITPQYLDTRSSFNSEQKYYLSDIMDTVDKRRYQKVLDPSNALVYNKLTALQKQLIIQLLEEHEPEKFDLTNLLQSEEYSFYPDEQAPKDLLFDWNASKLKFSKLSFSPNRDEVCLILEYYCGSRCGEGVLLFARKEKGAWNIVGRRRLWVS